MNERPNFSQEHNQSNTSEAENTPEKDAALIQSSLKNLDSKAYQAYEALFHPAGTITHEVFLAEIEAFNALPAEDRGKDVYDHSRMLTENKDRYWSPNIPSGFPLEVMLAKDGTISLKSIAGS